MRDLTFPSREARNNPRLVLRLQLLLNSALSALHVMRVSCIAVVLTVLVSSVLFPVSAQTNGSNTFKLPGSSQMGCWYWWSSYSLVGGERIVLQWAVHSQVINAVDLYITTPSEGAAKWVCDDGPSAYYYDFGAFGVTRWSAPRTGTYIVVVVNYGLYTVSGTLSLTVGGATIPFLASGDGVARQKSACPSGRQC